MNLMSVIGHFSSRSDSGKQIVFMPVVFKEHGFKSVGH